MLYFYFIHNFWNRCVSENFSSFCSLGLYVFSFTSYLTHWGRENGRHFPDDIFKCIFVNENVWIPVHISLKFVPKGPINNIPVLVRIMAWRRPGDKPLSEPMMARLPTYICVTRPQWVKTVTTCFNYNVIQFHKCFVRYNFPSLYLNLI